MERPWLVSSGFHVESQLIQINSVDSATKLTIAWIWGVSRQSPVKFHPWTHAEWTSVPVGVRWAAGLPNIRFQNGGISQVLAISMGKMLRIYWNIGCPKMKIMPLWHCCSWNIHECWMEWCGIQTGSRDPTNSAIQHLIVYCFCLACWERIL